MFDFLKQLYAPQTVSAQTSGGAMMPVQETPPVMPRRKRYPMDEVAPNGEPMGAVMPQDPTAQGYTPQPVNPDPVTNGVVRPRIAQTPIETITSPQTPTPLGAVKPSDDSANSVTLPVAESRPDLLAPTNSVSPAPVRPSDIELPRLNPVDQAYADLNETMTKDYSIKKDKDGNVIYRGKDRDKDFNWKDRLRSLGLGALYGLKTGGLGGAITGAVAGGIGGLVDRNYDDKLKDEMFTIPKQMRKLAAAQSQEGYNLKRQQEENAIRKQQGDIVAQQVGINGSLQEQVIKQNKPLWDSINADGQITKEEADQWQKTTGMPVNAVDARDFQEKEVGGTTYASPKKGLPAYAPVTTLPIQQDEKFVNVEVGEGDNKRSFTLKQKDAASLQKSIIDGDNQKAFQIALKNMDIANDNLKRSYDADTKLGELQANRDAQDAVRASARTTMDEIETELAGLQQQLANTPAVVTREATDAAGNVSTRETYNPERAKLMEQIESRKKDLANVKKTYIDADSAYTKFDSQVKNYKKPPKLQGIPPKGNGKSRYSQSDIERVIKQ